MAQGHSNVCAIPTLCLGPKAGRPGVSRCQADPCQDPRRTIPDNFVDSRLHGKALGIDLLGLDTRLDRTAVQQSVLLNVMHVAVLVPLLSLLPLVVAMRCRRSVLSVVPVLHKHPEAEGPVEIQRAA